MTLRRHPSPNACGWALLLVLASCSREAESGGGGQAAPAHELDVGAVRAAAIDGLEAAAEDPVRVRELGLADALAGPAVGPELSEAIERLLARLGQDPQLEAASDRFFTAVQDGPALRASLAAYARANPELDLSELTTGFVAHVDERLTRPAIAEAVSATLRAEVRDADAALAKAVVVEAELAELLAEAMLVRLGDPEVETSLAQRLGQDRATLEARLIERFAEPRRAGFALEALGEALGSEAGTLVLVTIVDHEQTATLVAEALTRALDDAAVRERGEALFALALADELDAKAFERELGELLAEPAVAREATVLLTSLARAKFVREQLAALVAVVVVQPEFGQRLVAALD